MADTSKLNVKTAFQAHDPSRSHEVIFTPCPPPEYHLLPFVTGGLGSLLGATKGGHTTKDSKGSVTEKDGVYSSNENGPLLGKRYRYMEELGQGGSAVVIKAMDTFRLGNSLVAIKILNKGFYDLGYQESNCIRRLNQADPQGISGAIKLLNTFQFDGHYCMVYELLQPNPLYHYFKNITQDEKLPMIRKVAIKLLQLLGFLQKQNVIHADLKPENILCAEGDLNRGIKVIDFGNAIHCIYDELALYYDDYELQTIVYRAPEVMCGLPFGTEIDLWSVGCILAELYIGRPLFFARSKGQILGKIYQLLGPLPIHVYQRGKFFRSVEHLGGPAQPFIESFNKLRTVLSNTTCGEFVSFILGFLCYDIGQRVTVQEAIQHPFLAPEIAIGFLLPNDQAINRCYSRGVSIQPSQYKYSPYICKASKKKSSIQLLKSGTNSGTISENDTAKMTKAVAQVPPTVRGPVKEKKVTKGNVTKGDVTIGEITKGIVHVKVANWKLNVLSDLKRGCDSHLGEGGGERGERMNERNQQGESMTEEPQRGRLVVESKADEERNFPIFVEDDNIIKQETNESDRIRQKVGTNCVTDGENKTQMVRVGLEEDTEYERPTQQPFEKCKRQRIPRNKQRYCKVQKPSMGNVADSVTEQIESHATQMVVCPARRKGNGPGRRAFEGPDKRTAKSLATTDCVKAGNRKVRKQKMIGKDVGQEELLGLTGSKEGLEPRDDIGDLDYGDVRTSNVIDSEENDNRVTTAGTSRRKGILEAKPTKGTRSIDVSTCLDEDHNDDHDCSSKLQTGSGRKSNRIAKRNMKVEEGEMMAEAKETKFSVRRRKIKQRTTETTSNKDSSSIASDMCSSGKKWLAWEIYSQMEDEELNDSPAKNEKRVESFARKLDYGDDDSKETTVRSASRRPKQRKKNHAIQVAESTIMQEMFEEDTNEGLLNGSRLNVKRLKERSLSIFASPPEDKTGQTVKQKSQGKYQRQKATKRKSPKIGGGKKWENDIGRRDESGMERDSNRKIGRKKICKKSYETDCLESDELNETLGSVSTENSPTDDEMSVQSTSASKRRRSEKGQGRMGGETSRNRKSNRRVLLKNDRKKKCLGCVDKDVTERVGDGRIDGDLQREVEVADGVDHQSFGPTDSTVFSEGGCRNKEDLVQQDVLMDSIDIETVDDTIYEAKGGKPKLQEFSEVEEVEEDMVLLL